MVTLVAHPLTGEIFTEKNPGSGFVTVRLESETPSLNASFLSITKRSCFISGKKEDMAKIFKHPGQSFPGIVQREVSLVPFYDGQTPVVNPTTGESMGKFQRFIWNQDMNAAAEVDVTERVKATASKAAAIPVIA